MIKHLRKSNIGMCKNRIQFTCMQFPYKLLGADFVDVGRRRGSRPGAAIVWAQVLHGGLTPALLIMLSALVPHTLNRTCPLQLPVSQSSTRMATSFLVSLILALDPAFQTHTGDPRLFHHSRPPYALSRPTSLANLYENQILCLPHFPSQYPGSDQNESILSTELNSIRGVPCAVFPHGGTKRDSRW